MGDGGSSSQPKNSNNCFIQYLRGEGVAEYRSFPDIRMLIWGPGYVSGIATTYELDGPGIESRSRHHFPYPSGPTLGPTQPPVQWVPFIILGGKAAGVWR